MKTVFPKEILNYTSELHRFNYLKKSQRIYSVILLTLTCLGAALPFVKIDLYRSSPGMIRPSKERNLITSPINGEVNEVFIKENSSVQKGDTILTLDDSSISKELIIVEEQFDSICLYINDLKKLSFAHTIQADSLKTALFKNQFFQYQQKLKALQETCNRQFVQFKRQKHLYQKGVIAKIDYESASFELEKTQNELLYFKKYQKSFWLNQLDQKSGNLSSLRTKLLFLRKQQGLHFILSPSTGSVQGYKDLEKNNYLYSGSAIAEISPQTDLMVECYVSPADIGLIKNKQPIKFQIDAFNHNHWGSASGQIIRINQDVNTINNLPMYKVLCSINEKNLFLNKTIRGSLQKGMTLTALFYIDNRSLLQLLFDEIEDWLNPDIETYV